MNLGDVTLRAGSDATVLKADSVQLSSKAERATAKFGTLLPVGSRAQLGIRFGGKLTGSLLGVGILISSIMRL